MSANNIAYIGIGSNLNNPVAQVRQMISQINELPASEVIKTSSFYNTSPVGVEGHPDFINAVIQLGTQLDCHDLLNELLALENIAGRERVAWYGHSSSHRQ